MRKDCLYFLIYISLLFAAFTPACWSQTSVAEPDAQTPTVTVEPLVEQPDHVATAHNGMLATVNPYATNAGRRAFEAGGNAVDAAVAAALMLGVVDTHNSGLGGGCFILIRCADGELIAIDGRETAPAKATRDMFLRDGKAVPSLSRQGPLAVAVPGALAAYEMALREHGKLPMKEMLQWSADRAETGFKLDRLYARHVRSASKAGLDDFPGLKALFVKENGRPLRANELLTQADLANSYRQIAEHGTEWFYKGEFAKKVSQWMAENGGILTEEDFASYAAKPRKPLETTYRNYTIVGFPPPSSGGIHVAEMLNILEHFDLNKLHAEDPAIATHVIAEAMKLAFADRAYWLGDSDYVRVPRGLVEKEYAAELAKRISLEKTIEVPAHGVPDGWEHDLFTKHTTHIAAADAQGNWVGITATVNTTYGSKVVVPGTGIVLNNEMDDFSAQPGVPNAFGLVGAENNAVEPGKRPLSSMTPTIVLKDGKPVFTVGAAGGPKIITQSLLAIIRYLDYGMPLGEALKVPRFHHQWTPATLFCEKGFDEAEKARLIELGHVVVESPSAGVSQAVGLDEDGWLTGVHDPRVLGKAGGF